MKKIKLIDIAIIIAFILAMVVGFLTYKHFRQTAEHQLDRTSKIAFQVFLRGVTITSGVNPIRVGDKTFISIRNVPYTALQVVDSKIDTKKVVMPNPEVGKKPQFVVVEDFSQIFMYDIVVTVTDIAKITKDGPVVGGNKIKIGMPITLEGADYKFNGTVSNIQILPDNSPPPAAPPKQNAAQPPASSATPPAAPQTQQQPPAPQKPQPPQPPVAPKK